MPAKPFSKIYFVADITLAGSAESICAGMFRRDFGGNL